MSKLVDEIVKELFTDYKGNPIPRLLQEGTGGAGWSEYAVRAIIDAALGASGLTPTPGDICHCGPEKYHHEHDQDPFCSKCGGKQ